MIGALCRRYSVGVRPGVAPDLTVASARTCSSERGAGFGALNCPILIAQKVSVPLRMIRKTPVLVLIVPV
jgi:hypothetical protein